MTYWRSQDCSRYYRGSIPELPSRLPLYRGNETCYELLSDSSVTRQFQYRSAVEIVQKDRERAFEQFRVPLKDHQRDGFLDGSQVRGLEHARFDRGFRGHSVRPR